MSLRIESIPMRKERMEMIDIDQACRPAGWMMKDRSGDCTQILPCPGTTILIGRTKASGRTKTGKVNLIWVDSKGELVVLPLEIKKDRVEIKIDGRPFVLTIKRKGDERIEGEVKEGKGSKVPFDPAGTWGADINPGG
jgi:hypothetical protein